MFNKKSTSFRLLSAGMLSASLAACGGGGSNNFSPVDLTIAQKQVIAKATVETIDIFELIDAILTISNQIGSLASGSLACVSGSGTSTIVNNAPLASFDAGDSINISATNCVDSDGDAFNGTINFTGLTIAGATATNASFSGTGLVNESVDGAIQIIPSVNFNPNAGTGSISASIDQLTSTEAGVTVGLQDGSYNLALSGASYTYNVEHDITSNLFTGSVKAQTATSGFTGITSLDSSGDFSVNNPLAGNMTITFPDGSTAAVDANTGNAATYSLTVDGQVTTEPWEQ